MMSHDEDTDTQLSFVSMPQAVSLRRWALRAVAGPLAGAVFEASSDLRIGRAPAADVRCNDPTVSREHAAVRRRGDALFIEDLGSRNGTVVNGQRIERSTRLWEGQRVDLGALSFRVVREDEHELSESKRLYDAATSDPVTGVHNRSYFDMRLSGALESAQHERRSVALLLVDLDYFKSVNDRFGHLTGDAALRCVGQTIASVVRPVDTVARWGGEEFVVLLPGTSMLEAALIADRVRRQIEQLDTAQLDMDCPLTVSVGVAAEPECGACSPPALIAAADIALYRAKAEGRNRVHVYSEETDFETQRVRRQGDSSGVLPPSTQTRITPGRDGHDESTIALPRRA
jgi:diguanylate cyclase (GGDEF)-like protein